MSHNSMCGSEQASWQHMQRELFSIDEWPKKYKYNKVHNGIIWAGLHLTPIQALEA